MTPRSGPQTEQERHKQAFEHYVAQGPGRSHQRTAEALGVSLAAVKAWSRAFGWKQRLAERDAETTRKMADQAQTTGVVEGHRNLKIVHLGLLTLAKGIKEGRIKGQMSDVDRLIRLEEDLLGGEGRLCRNPDRACVDQIHSWSPEQRRNFMVDAALKTARENPEALERLRKGVSDLVGEQDQQTGAGTPPAGV